MRTVLTVAFCALGNTVVAEMPRYDVESQCTSVASFSGDYSASLFNGCIDMEQSAYNAVKQSWERLPETMQSHCNSVASFSGAGSYSLLEGCVRMELEATNSSKTFKY